MITEIRQTQAHRSPERLTAPPLQKAAAVVYSDLRWVQPSVLKMRYELRSANQPIARMHFEGLLSSKATAESADGCWTFERAGTSQGRIVIHVCTSRRDVAVFESDARDRGGTLSLPDGRRFTLTSDFWKGRGEFLTEKGEPLVRFHFHGVIRQGATVDILAKAARLPELPCLLMLGWYLNVAYV
jgi:hypothetical protein